MKKVIIPIVFLLTACNQSGTEQFSEGKNSTPTELVVETTSQDTIPEVDAVSYSYAKPFVV